MLFHRQRLTLSLSPDRLSAALFRGGRAVQHECIMLNPADWAPAWEQGLTQLDSPLRRIIARFRTGRTTPIDVLYHSPTAIIRTEEAGGTKPQAEAAIRLKLGSGNSERLRTSAHAVAPANSAANNDGSWFVIAVSEPDETMNSIFAWVNRCGGLLGVVQPAQSAIAQQAARFVRDSDERKTCCYIGAEWSAVVCGSRDGIELARIFELGYRPLLDVYRRYADTHEDAAMPDPGKTLYEFGIPTKPDMAPPEFRSAILPALYPVVQRLSVEIKQTLRFGLGSNAAPSELHLIGPGATIPHLGTTLTESLDMHVMPAPESDSAEFAPGTYQHTFATLPRGKLAVTPQPALVEQASTHAKSMTLAGAVAAAAIIAGEFAWLSYRERDLQAEFELMSPTIAAIANERERVEIATELAAVAGSTARSIQQRVHSDPSFDQLLAAISQATSQDARFHDIEIKQTSRGYEALLRGTAKGQAPLAARDALNAMLGRLEQHPQIESIELGTVTSETDSDDGHAVRIFTLTAIVREAPPYYEPIAAYAAAQEAADE